MTDSKMLALIQAELPDSYTESKDWRYGDAIERIIWLKLMLESKTREIEWLLDMNEKNTDRLCAEIERLEAKLENLLGGAETVLEAWDSGDEASFREAIEELRADVAEARGDKDE